MLAVHRDNLAALTASFPHDEPAGADDALLVRKREPSAVPQRAEARLEARRAPDTVYSDIRLRRGERFFETLLSQQYLEAFGSGFRPFPCLAVVQDDIPGAEFEGLRENDLDVAARGQDDELRTRRESAADIKRLKTY